MMTIRTASILFLFFGASMTTGIVLALVLAIADRSSGATLGPWIFPAVALPCFVAIFFLGRAALLPPTLASPPLKALTMLTAWMAATLTATMALTWALAPLTSAVGVGSGPIVIWLACIGGSVTLLDRWAGRSQRRGLQ